MIEITPDVPAAEPVLAADDTGVAPAEMADADIAKYIPADILARYEIHSYRNAALILSQACPAEFAELMDALRTFSLTRAIIEKAGGNESDIPKLLSGLLRPSGWHETTIQADLVIRQLWREPGIGPTGKSMKTAMVRDTTRARYLDGHKVDYVKGRVAFDLEWNSKDQTFDRDLYAFSAFSQCGIIDVGVLLTRSAGLNELFRQMGLMGKYGASTTWMGKLLYRLNAGRNGSCPVLAIGITSACVTDWIA
jgi:CRISPR-associated protein Csd2